MTGTRTSSWPFLGRSVSRMERVCPASVDDVGEIAVVDHPPARHVRHLQTVGVPDAIQFGDRPGQIEPIGQVLEAFLVIEGDGVVAAIEGIPAMAKSSIP